MDVMCHYDVSDVIFLPAPNIFCFENVGLFMTSVHVLYQLL